MMTNAIAKASEVPTSAAQPKKERILWRRCHRRAVRNQTPERTFVTLLRFTEEPLR